MIKPTPRTGLVSHKLCLDGTGSALMFLRAGGRKENILFKNPHECALKPGELDGCDEIWFVDVCPQSLEDPACGRSYLVIDHHESNVRRHKGAQFCVFSDVECGTSLFAQQLGGTPAGDRQLVQAIKDYDFGRFDVEDAEFIADFASIYSQEVLLDLFQASGDLLFATLWVSTRVKTVKKLREDYALKAAESVRMDYVVLDGETTTVGVTSSPGFWKNSVCRAILDKYPDVMIAAVVDPLSGAVSLRSRKDGPNVAKIAEKFGGGGHAQAAGIRVRIDRMNRLLLDEIFS